MEFMLPSAAPGAWRGAYPIVSQHYPPLICLEAKLLILLRGGLSLARLASPDGWWLSGQSFPGWLPPGKGLCSLWAWCDFLLGKNYLHFCVLRKGHPGLG